MKAGEGNEGLSPGVIALICILAVILIPLTILLCVAARYGSDNVATWFKVNTSHSNPHNPVGYIQKDRRDQMSQRLELARSSSDLKRTSTEENTSLPTFSAAKESKEVTVKPEEVAINMPESEEVATTAVASAVAASAVSTALASAESKEIASTSAMPVGPSMSGESIAVESTNVAVEIHAPAADEAARVEAEAEVKAVAEKAARKMTEEAMLSAVEAAARAEAEAKD